MRVYVCTYHVKFINYVYAPWQTSDADIDWRAAMRASKENYETKKTKLLDREYEAQPMLAVGHSGTLQVLLCMALAY